MLTFVTATDGAPYMRDVLPPLRKTIDIIGCPDEVVVFDSTLTISGEVCVRFFECVESERFVEKIVKRVSHHFPGDCIFVRTQNFNLIGDLSVIRAYRRHIPGLGNSARLVRMPTGSRANILTLDEKFGAQ